MALSRLASEQQAEAGRGSDGGCWWPTNFAALPALLLAWLEGRGSVVTVLLEAGEPQEVVPATSATESILLQSDLRLEQAAADCGPDDEGLRINCSVEPCCFNFAAAAVAVAASSPLVASCAELLTAAPDIESVVVLVAVVVAATVLAAAVTAAASVVVTMDSPSRETGAAACCCC